MNLMLLQQESECQPSVMVPRFLKPQVNSILNWLIRIKIKIWIYRFVMVMLHVKQFSSAEGKGWSNQPKSGTGSRICRSLDQTHLFSLSMSFPAVQYSNRVLRRLTRWINLVSALASASLCSDTWKDLVFKSKTGWSKILTSWAFSDSHIFLASIQPMRSLEIL